MNITCSYDVTLMMTVTVVGVPRVVVEVSKRVVSLLTVDVMVREVKEVVVVRLMRVVVVKFVTNAIPVVEAGSSVVVLTVNVLLRVKVKKVVFVLNFVVTFVSVFTKIRLEVLVMVVAVVVVDWITRETVRLETVVKVIVSVSIMVEVTKIVLAVEGQHPSQAQAP